MIGTALIAAVLAAALPVHPARGQEPTTSAVVQADVDRLVRRLYDAAADNQQRDEAARRLVARRSPVVRELTRNILQDLGNPAAQVAVARALSDVADPDPSFVEPLFILLQGPRTDMIRAAAGALANYRARPDVLQRLVNVIDGHRNETMRLAAIEALGGIPEKLSAATLVGVLGRENESPAVVAAAAEALERLTGLSNFGMDRQRWGAWWLVNADRTEAEFHEQLVTVRANRADVLEREQRRMADATAELLRVQLQAAPVPEARTTLLMQMLSSDAPEIRALGTAVAQEDKSEGRNVPDQVVARVREMIGDSDKRVRLEVALAVQKFNDREALEPLLAQLAQEENPDVRAAIARALGPIGDVRAAPALIAMLDDPSLVAAIAAADALEDLAPNLSEPDRRRAAASLRALLDRGDGPGQQELREAVVEAMVPLKQRELISVFQQLLRQATSARLRRNALRGIAEIGDSNYADIVASHLNDREEGVRLEAIRALGRFGAIEHAEKLVRLTDPANAQPEEIRDEAWRAFQSLLGNMSTLQLAQFKSQLAHDPAKRLVVLQALEKNLIREGDDDQLASERQNIAQTQFELGQFEQAAASYGSALEYLQGQPGSSKMAIQRMIDGKLDSLLRGGNYAEAGTFASQLMADPEQRQVVGQRVKLEVERLQQQSTEQHSAEPLDRALRLIDQFRKTDPPLPGYYQDNFAELESDIRKAIAAIKQGSGLPGYAPQLSGDGAVPGRMPVTAAP